jgi:hypothetical protein
MATTYTLKKNPAIQGIQDPLPLTFSTLAFDQLVQHHILQQIIVA